MFHGARLDEIRKQGIEWVAIAIAGGEIRLRIKRDLEARGFELVNVIHPRAHVAPSVSLGAGNFSKAGAIEGVPGRSVGRTRGRGR